MKYYLASPFFNSKERSGVETIAQCLRKRGHEVYVPMEHEIPNAWDMPNKDWAKAVFDEDVKAINNCEKVIVLNWGMYSDSGTAWECGYAYAKQKEVITLLMPSREKEYSLMMINGSTKAIPWLDFIENREWANLNAINQK